MTEKKKEYSEFLIRLYEDQKEWLRLESFESRKSQSEIIREALELYRNKRKK